MTNDYLEYYQKYKISPVKQDLSDLNKHFYIREMLYQALGVPKTSFHNKKVLEVGPGGGFNSIVTASFEPKLYQLVEANPTGIEDINENLRKYNISNKNIQISNTFIENFETSDQFDIIICENMLCCVKNNYEILNKLESLLASGGILIISCADEISTFYDMTRRLFANILIHKNKDKEYNELIDILVDSFESHLKTLKGFYKHSKDWCADNLMGNSLYNTSLAVSDVIDFFSDRLYFYQITPNIIVDEQWHKEIPLSIKDYNKRKIDLYEQIWHNVFHYKVMNQKREPNKNVELRKLCREYFDLVKKSEKDYNDIVKEELVSNLKKIETNISNLDNKIKVSLDEIIDCLNNDKITSEEISSIFSEFNQAFGKGQQYISLIKKK